MKYEEVDIKIRDVQMVQLEILLEFDRICKKHNLQYQLYAGTLLGSVRHKGFIPWDDDIDVCMLRKDYEQFLKYCEEDLDAKYFLQYYLTDKKAILQFAKIRKNNTLFVNAMDREFGMHTGIYIDIFPLDNVNPDSLLGKMQPWIFNCLYIINSSRQKARALNARNNFNKYMRLLLHYIVQPIPKRLMDELMQKTLRMYQNRDTDLVNMFSNGVTKLRIKKTIMDKRSFYDMMFLEFEGYYFPGPKNYDKVLTQMFGNYMTPPPEAERKPHHGIIEVRLDKE